MTSGNGSAPAGPRPAGTGAIWAALATVYVVWGSTYLAIRVAVETIPPLLMASLRFLVAGAILYPWAIRRGDRTGDRPTARQWGAAAIIGTALLVGGNGGVALAEQTVPTGIAALLIATVPLWMVLMARVVLRERVGWQEALGIGVGFGGIALLVNPNGSGGFDPVGVGILMFASISWAAGSLYARRAPMPGRQLVGTAMQMLTAGAVLAVAGVVAGELADVEVARVSTASLVAVGYLVVFGSLVAFSAYVWLLRAARTSLVSTYAYVNPVVAVFLGWAFLSEALTVQTVVAGGVIVVGVALIVTARAEKPASEPAGEPAADGVPSAHPPAEPVSGEGSAGRTPGSTARSP